MSEVVRDPKLPERLLVTERDALMPLLRRAPERAFDLPTACPDWSVRQVLAHCGAALTRISHGRLEPGVFSPESNASDVAERDSWPLAAVLDELERGMSQAGAVIAARSDGILDLVALGEWIHAGDVRESLGVPGAYSGDGIGEALALLVIASRRRKTPRLHATLPDRQTPLLLGVEIEGRPPARLICTASTLIRLYADRPLADSHYELTGAQERELHIFA
ncbi:maleylpyruvate isomerase family mycothiol-dependent enzyme [Nonomuraea sp. M3C6]|uniref:Maleylpyruvate isomerase family mycothiol-dependent enzyme n=1 Tax=Nonomuraea marmarensis TaxID=3351344 RepID=A0ABW7AUI5_9ACTN